MYKPRIDITGQKYGNWTAIKYVGAKYWICECECGYTSKIDGSKLRNGKTSACRSCANRKYQDINDCGSRLYSIWNNMKQRCRNKEIISYKWYGGRGITVCREWNDFIKFKEWAISNGYDDNLTIDRIDNDGNYEPDNCQWLTKSQNTIKSQNERELKGNNTGEKNIYYNTYKKKYDVIIDKKFVGNYHTIKAAIIERDWFAERKKQDIIKKEME